LQNEPNPILAYDKIALIERLVEAGLHWIEAGSFVSPTAIPQLKDSEEVFQGIAAVPTLHAIGLVPNEKGLSRALSAGAKHVAVFAAASETFSQKNIRTSIEGSLSLYHGIVAQAKREKLWVRGYISCVWGCPYEGEVDTHRVLSVVKSLLDSGVDEISLGDTIGVATPNRVNAMLSRVIPVLGLDRCAVHFHDTYGQAIANIAASLELGVHIVDSSVAGLGGCPYAKGATGNVATEDVLYLLQGLGIHTGVDMGRLAQVGQWISDILNRENGSKAGKAWLARHDA
jgi:hydroxymethylglutaryl-CoA lyase